MPSLPEPLGKFFDDRGPHLAAMIAYFALLSFVPLLFLTVSLLGLAGRPDESSYLVTELKRAFPGSSVASIVHTVREIQKHATALGILGGAALLWTSLSLFSVLESAFNIVYGKPNRSFLRGKLLAVGLMLLSLVTRSEEHTSELQSPVHLVCRLLLEKKKLHTISLDCIAMNLLH